MSYQEKRESLFAQLEALQFMQANGMSSERPSDLNEQIAAVKAEIDVVMPLARAEYMATAKPAPAPKFSKRSR
jgi:hypothetical protein